MRPALLQWRGITIWSYPAMLYLGLVAGVFAGNSAAHAAGLDAFHVFVATLILIGPAIAGARLLYVASNWQAYRSNLARIWDRREGGMAMLGGLPVALVISLPLLSALQLDFGAFWDVAVFTMLVGTIFARAGCLLNGCCAGRPSKSWLAVYLPNATGVWERRLPTQCMEAAWAGVLLAAAFALRSRAPFPGALFLCVLLGYGAGRLVLQWTRESKRAGPSSYEPYPITMKRF